MLVQFCRRIILLGVREGETVSVLAAANRKRIWNTELKDKVPDPKANLQ